MHNYKINLQIGCVYQCRIIYPYDGWQSLQAIFSRYNVVDLKIDLYNLFKTAAMNLERFYSETDILDLTYSYEHIDVLIEDLFLAAKEKGVITEIPGTPLLLPRHKKNNEPSMIDSVFTTCRMYHPHEIRDAIWDMFQWGISAKSARQTKKGRRQMITLYETITDLISAAYFLYYQAGCPR
ncbi:hypothetical protein [Paraflavitalea pollutisoli]|uniref:hypothetical protein n=1 Tax=Paraflavitalea pollutisoli TaxID=3034143 RepID=UPI0023EAC012|nr:hypothetical protein [Paraflavitalea sp. H1-2-19X]